MRPGPGARQAVGPGPGTRCKIEPARLHLGSCCPCLLHLGCHLLQVAPAAPGFGPAAAAGGVSHRKLDAVGRRRCPARGACAARQVRVLVIEVHRFIEVHPVSASMPAVSPASRRAASSSAWSRRRSKSIFEVRLAVLLIRGPCILSRASLHACGRGLQPTAVWAVSAGVAVGGDSAALRASPRTSSS